MPINLNNKEGRKTFIDNNLPDLLTAINDTYGPIILEELLKRIEFTINEFNDQINEFIKVVILDSFLIIFSIL